MTWNDTAWAIHLMLAPQSTRYMSVSRFPLRVYWLPTKVVMLNDQTGEARIITPTDAEESSLMYSGKAIDKRMQDLFEKGTPYVP